MFVVRIRDDAGGSIRGVRIEDNGAKMGLNGTKRVSQACGCST